MRTQPFHYGHKSLVDKMLEECEYSTIILGSAQEERTQKNPFTLAERELMLRNVYGPRLDGVTIFGLSDIENDSDWRGYVLENITEKTGSEPPVEVYYCGRDEDGEWFDDGKIKIEKLERSEQTGRRDICATRIRDMVRQGDLDWRNYVPPENFDIISEVLKEKIVV